MSTRDERERRASSAFVAKGKEVLKLVVEKKEEVKRKTKQSELGKRRAFQGTGGHGPQGAASDK